jgi:hypothetical protein
LENPLVEEVIVEEAEAVLRLRIKDATIVNLLNLIDADERPRFIERAIIIGAQVLQAQNTTSRVDFVKGEFERFKTEIDTEMQRLFSQDGVLTRQLGDFLGPKGELAKSLEQHFGEDGTIATKILNPTDSSAPLGKFMTQLHKELDPSQEGSAFFDMRKCIDDRFEKLRLDLGVAEAKQRAAEEERAKGTAKGRDWQNYVYETLYLLTKPFEDEVEPVWDESGPIGKVGDIVIKVNSKDTGGIPLTIVVECKDTPVRIGGKNSFLKELDEAKTNRSALYAIGAVSDEFVPEAVGAFRRFDGGKIICSLPEEGDPLALEVSYKVARDELIMSLQQRDVCAKPADMLPKIASIRAQLENLRAMKTSLGNAKTKIDEVRSSLETMEEGIKDDLEDLESLIKTNGGEEDN